MNSIEYTCQDETVTVTYTVDVPGSWWAETDGNLIQGAGNYGEAGNAGTESVTYEYTDGLIAYIQTDTLTETPIVCELPYTGLPAGILVLVALLLVTIGQKLVRP